MPFNWTLNPYRGCTHGCHYCFARRYHAQFEMNADDEFASVILVKQQHRRRAARASSIGRRGQRDYVAVGTATDPYQPIEGHYKLTRALDRGPRARAARRSASSRRDRWSCATSTCCSSDARAARCTVYMSVPTVDEDAWRTLEPGTAHPLQRLRAVRELVDAGINAGVLMAPIVPGFSSSRTSSKRTIKAIADHGARFVGCNVMYLQDGTRDALHELHRARISRDAAALREAVREEISARRLPQGSAGDGARAAGALRPVGRRERTRDIRERRRPEHRRRVGIRRPSAESRLRPED